MTREVRGARSAFALACALALGACHEIPQDAAKPYAGKDDTKAYAGDLFKGDKDKYEQALAARAQTQNEYIRTGGVNKTQ
jgi:hypothetical protein